MPRSSRSSSLNSSSSQGQQQYVPRRSRSSSLNSSGSVGVPRSHGQQQRPPIRQQRQRPEPSPIYSNLFMNRLINSEGERTNDSKPEWNTSSFRENMDQTRREKRYYKLTTRNINKRKGKALRNINRKKFKVIRNLRKTIKKNLVNPNKKYTVIERRKLNRKISKTMKKHPGFKIIINLTKKARKEINEEYKKEMQEAKDTMNQSRKNRGKSPRSLSYNNSSFSLYSSSGAVSRTNTSNGWVRGSRSISSSNSSSSGRGGPKTKKQNTKKK